MDRQVTIDNYGWACFNPKVVSAIIYSQDGCGDCETMRQLLDGLGVKTQVRLVDGDAGARREWESVGGRITPLVVVRQAGVVRGLACAPAKQPVRWSGGCAF